MPYSDNDLQKINAQLVTAAPIASASLAQSGETVGKLSTKFGYQFELEERIAQEFRKLQELSGQTEDPNYRLDKPDLDLAIQQYKQINPKAQLKTRKDIENELIDEYITAQQNIYLKSLDASTLDTVNLYANMLGGYLQDPVNLASVALPTAGIKGGQILASGLKMAGLEAGINAVLFAKDEPTRQTIEPNRTGADTLSELGTSSAVSAILGFGVGAIGAKLLKPSKPIPDNKAPVMTETIRARADESLKKAPDLDDVDTARELNDIVHDTPSGLTQSQHAQNFHHAMDDYVNGREIRLPNSLTVEEDLAVMREFEGIDIQPKQAEAIKPNEQDLFRINQINETRAALKNSNVTLDIEDDLGNVVSSHSGRQLLDDLSEDVRALENISRCFNSGGPK